MRNPASASTTLARMTKPVAILIPVRIKFADPQDDHWLFKLIAPHGVEITPWMRKRRARDYCKEHGWKPVEADALAEEFEVWREGWKEFQMRVLLG
jgi:hypothetical protein